MPLEAGAPNEKKVSGYHFGFGYPFAPFLQLNAFKIARKTEPYFNLRYYDFFTKLYKVQKGDFMETYIIAGTNSSGTVTADFDFDIMREEIEKADKALEAAGGKVLHAWNTLGRFDFVVVVEVPNAAAVRAWVACIGVTTETMRAFSGPNDDSEFRENTEKILTVMSQ